MNSLYSLKNTIGTTNDGGKGEGDWDDSTIGAFPQAKKQKEEGDYGTSPVNILGETPSLYFWGEQLHSSHRGGKRGRACR